MSNKAKNQELTIRQSVTPAKIKRLTKKALKNGFKASPAKGFNYLKNLPIGSLFQIGSGTDRGILLSCDHDAYVIITKSHSKDELGKKYISSDTEVKEITKV